MRLPQHAAYKRKLGEAQAALADITVAIKLSSGNPGNMARCVTRGVFKGDKMSALCKALTQDGALDTRELAVLVARTKELDVGHAGKALHRDDDRNGCFR